METYCVLNSTAGSCPSELNCTQVNHIKILTIFTSPSNADSFGTGLSFSTYCQIYYKPVSLTCMDHQYALIHNTS